VFATNGRCSEGGGNDVAWPNTPSNIARNASNCITLRCWPLPHDRFTDESIDDSSILRYVFAGPTSSQYSYSVILRMDVYRVMVKLARFAVYCHSVGRSADACRYQQRCTKFALVRSHDAARTNFSRCVFDGRGLSCQQRARITLVWWRTCGRGGRTPHSLNRFALFLDGAALCKRQGKPD